MLSAAHILAMNAKNLLDVIDNVRIKHPHVDVLFTAPSWSDMTAQHHPSHSTAASPTINYKVTSLP